jgi:glycosyltransferase involved in cell wall biosynthesis
MISFVSTFPPTMCGIGTYTSYITSNMPRDKWRVIAFKLGEFAKCHGDMEIAEGHRVNYSISLDNPLLPPVLTDLLWFQHSFGMWGNVNTHFLKLIEEGKRRENKVGASFHTIHFQSEETSWGMQEKEWGLLREALPLLDFITVFSLGAYRAVVGAFPHYREKVVVLRHGVHRYPRVSQDEARRKLVSYLIHQAKIPLREKEEVRRIEKSLTSRNTVLLGNYGFITPDKDALQLYELGRLVQERIANYRVITLYVGKIQEKKDKKSELSLPILKGLKSIHNWRENLFYEEYIPETMFPLAFRALDFAVFWCHNATQSGRMAHAQGTGVPVVGRKWEGVGETLERSGLPAAETLDELAEKTAEIVREPRMRGEMERLSWRYADRYSFYNQAKKHLLLEETLKAGMRLPVLDGETADDLYTGKISRGRLGGFGETWRGDRLHTQRH